MKKLIIGADTYDIEHIKGLSAYGYLLPSKKKIQISADIPARDKRITELHEAIHAVCASYGLRCEVEELVVRALEVGITRMFIDNPSWTKQFIKALDA